MFLCVGICFLYSIFVHCGLFQGAGGAGAVLPQVPAPRHPGRHGRLHTGAHPGLDRHGGQRGNVSYPAVCSSPFSYRSPPWTGSSWWPERPCKLSCSLYSPSYRSPSWTGSSWRPESSVSDPHKFSCGSGSRIPKMSIWIRIRLRIRIQGGKHKRRISKKKNFN